MSAELKIWVEPNTTEKMLEKLHTNGYLPSKELDEWSAPGEHRIPYLNLGEIVLFRWSEDWGCRHPISFRVYCITTA